MASGGHNKMCNEQVATPRGELTERHTVWLARAICFHTTHCVMSSVYVIPCHFQPVSTFVFQYAHGPG